MHHCWMFLKRAIQLISFSKLEMQFDRVLIISGSPYNDLVKVLQDVGYTEYCYGKDATVFQRNVLSHAEAAPVVRSLFR